MVLMARQNTGTVQGVNSFPEAGPGEAINLGKPSEPRPAATILLLRDREEGGLREEGVLEVLMLKRSAESHFMPSVWVFPGGSLDPEDGEGLDGLRTCAARELHEEAGIRLDLSTELIPLARWVTPEVVKTRFDTWFFIARAPLGVEAKPDNFEMTEAVWVNPADALAAAEAGDMAIVFPTLKQLEALVPSAHAAQAMERAAADPNASRVVLPKVIGDERNARIVLPHEDDYPD
jgi:8-oxo-dGTP pyrophosphatase MutT (NUDIX family)